MRILAACVLWGENACLLENKQQCLVNMSALFVWRSPVVCMLSHGDKVHHISASLCGETQLKSCPAGKCATVDLHVFGIMHK